jgi:hypothetical protein
MATLVGCSITGGIFTIDPATGTGASVGTSNVNGLNSLAADASGTLYSVSGVTPLVTIDPQTAVATTVTALQPSTDVRDLAFSSSGVLFAIRDGGLTNGVFDPDDLVTIDRATGAVTVVGSTGRGTLQALAFSPCGTLYGWDVSYGLVMINTATGAATLVDPAAVAGTAADIQGLTFAPDGTLYGAREALFRVDASSGATTLIGSGGYSDVRGIAFTGTSSRAVSPAVIFIAWAWMILTGYILITPIGPLCIVCGNPLRATWVIFLGIGSVVLGAIGLLHEVQAVRARPPGGRR